MADTADSKSAPGNRVGVQVPPGAFPAQPHVKNVWFFVWLTVAAMTYALAPAALLAWFQQQTGYRLLRAVTNQAVTFSLILTLLLLAARLPIGRRALAGVVVALATLYGCVLWLVLGYWLWTGHQFDAYFALDAGQDVIRTLRTILGTQLYLLGGAFVFSAWGFWTLWWRAAQWIRETQPKLFRSWSLFVPLALQVALWYFSIHEQSVVWPEVAAVVARVQRDAVVGPIFPDTTTWQTQLGDSVYILQLESGNALAISGSLKVRGRRYNGNYAPNLHRLAGSGVFFPKFWSNSVQSNRALENILCGITNNTGPALSYNPAKIVSDCLPAVLRRAGYKTIFYVSFDDPNFMNYRNFVRALGFEEFLDAPSLGFARRPDSWGADDCAFYAAVFADLERRPAGEKRFVYVGVSAHHYPFSGHKRYQHLHPFPLPQAPVEWYLNSWMEQDHCLAEFYRLYLGHTRGEAHLFVTPDHSWPVGLHDNFLNEYGWYQENFAIPFLYVPPASRAGEFRVGEKVEEQPSLSDLPPTILELLDGKARQQSFATLLRRYETPPQDLWEPCHILAQPYGGGAIVIQRRDEKYVYHLQRHRLERYDLVNDPEERAPQLVAEPISYAEVRRGFYCQRYRNQGN